MCLARTLAIRAHRGQVDKAGEDYYLAHVSDVAYRVGEDPLDRTVAYLHDIVEDTPWTLDALAHIGFLCTGILNSIDAITHRPGEPRDDYYGRVKANPRARRVKLADIASNLDPDRLDLLDEATAARLVRKYAHALDVLGPGR